MNLVKDNVIISKDKNKLDVEYIHAYLITTYWANNRTKKQLETSIEHCICFGAYLDSRQIGFARVLTDHVTFAYLMDVFVDEAHRGQGIASQLMNAMLYDDELKHLSKWCLGTRDAHDLYKGFGFTALTKPEMWMERLNS